MKLDRSLSKSQKIEVLFRLEPGCLGPQGAKHVENFCISMAKELVTVDADFVCWNILPRYDKSKPEIEYKLNSKILSHDKAEKYLKLFNRNIDDFEESLHDKLALHIDEYLGH